MDPSSRARFFRRIALGLAAMVALVVLSVFASGWILAGQLGRAGWAPAVPAVLVLELYSPERSYEGRRPVRCAVLRLR